MRIGVFDLYKTDTQIKNGHFVMYIGVSAQQNQILSEYELRTIFFEKKECAKVVRRQTPSFVNRIGLTKSQPYVEILHQYYCRRLR